MSLLCGEYNIQLKLKDTGMACVFCPNIYAKEIFYIFVKKLNPIQIVVCITEGDARELTYYIPEFYLEIIEKLW